MSIQPLEKVEPNPLAILENESYQPLEKVEPNPLAILENESSENLRSEEESKDLAPPFSKVESEEESKDLALPFSKVDSEEESKDLAPPFPKVESKDLAPPFPKVEKVVSKVVKKAVERLSVKYNFEVEEALLYLSQPCQPLKNQPLKKVEPKVKSESLKNQPLKKVEPKVKSESLKKVEPKVKSESLKKVEPNFSTTFQKSGKVEPKIEKLKAKYPMPFDGIKREECCNGLVKNHGLYTQCSKKVKGLCKSCEKGVYLYGNIDDRVKVGLYEYKDPKGKSAKRYTEVLKALKVSKEEVEEEAKRLNVVISAEHLEEVVVVDNVKRGRPKAEKKVKEATGKKGRPKKETKKVEVNDDEEEDLFATLIANAHNQPLGKVEPNPMPLEGCLEGCLDVIVEDAKDVIVEEAKDLAPPLSKVDKKQKKAEEKAAKDAAKEAEKQKKAEEKAAKEAEKQKKAEEKASKESKKKSKDLAPPLPKVDNLAPPLSKVEKSKDLAPPLSKVEKVDNEEADVVNKLEFEGKSYYKSKKSGVIYNMEQEVVGKWNEERKGIDFEEEEEEEEEYDD